MISSGNPDPRTGRNGRSRLPRPLALACAVAAFALSASAGADPYIVSGGKPAGDTGLTPLLGIRYELFDENVLEIGFAGSFVVAPDGFIPPINDQVHVEGVILQDVIASDPTGMIGGRMRWDFHLHPQWSAFAAPGVGIRYGDPDRDRGVDVTGQVGGFFHMNPGLSLRAEADVFGWRGGRGIRAGATFRF